MASNDERSKKTNCHKYEGHMNTVVWLVHAFDLKFDDIIIWFCPIVFIDCMCFYNKVEIMFWLLQKFPTFKDIISNMKEKKCQNFLDQVYACDDSIMV